MTPDSERTAYTQPRVRVVVVWVRRALRVIVMMHGQAGEVYPQIIGCVWCHAQCYPEACSPRRRAVLVAQALLSGASTVETGRIDFVDLEAHRDAGDGVSAHGFEIWVWRGA